jgi:hypothetical protein
MGEMGPERQDPPAERHQAQQEDAAAGEPDAALPPHRGEDPADTAHHQHSRKCSKAECQHHQEAGRRGGRAGRLGNEGIDEGAGKKAVEDAKRERRREAFGPQQAAQGCGECVAAEAEGAAAQIG